MFVCCGEVLIDMLPRAGADGTAHYLPASGGAAFNTAIALARLSVPTGCFTGLSNDFFGDQLRDALVASGVDVSLVRFSERQTTLAFVRLANGQPSYAFFDENSAGRMLTEADLPALGAETKALHFSGISLIPEPCGSTYEALMRRERGRCVMVLDPNIRTAFVGDRQRHLERLRRMIAMADIVKVSDEDLAWFEESGSTDEIARRWLNEGPKLVVVTAGARGATAWTRQVKVSMPAIPAEVVDTVGAGDTFVAGMLASLHGAGLVEKQALDALTAPQLEDALSLAVKVAAVSVSRAGANPPWRHELAL